MRKASFARMQNKVILITGASGGIGAACAAKLAPGNRVYALSRSGRAPEGSIPIICDVTDPEALRAAVDTVGEREGRIDAALLCAGCGISGAVEFIPPEEAERQFAVNFFGVDNALRVLTPYLRKSRGRVLAVSSAAAVFPIPFQAHYSAGKAALNVLMRAYGIEVRPFGIEAGSVMLGDCATGFTAARKKCEDGDELYGGRISAGVAAMERDERRGASPEQIAARIVKILSRRRLPSLRTVGASYRLLVFLSRILPIRLQNYILSRLY